MNYHRSSERGQALVLIALAMIGLVGITGLAIDGSVAFSDRRHAQNAADTAALAGALAKARGQDLYTTAKTRAASNGYEGDQTVFVSNPPAAGCKGTTGPYAGNNEYIQVMIRATTRTYFGPVVGIRTLENCVEATARAEPPTVVTPFFGNAIVGLNPNGFSYDAWGDSEWYIHGGGVFANGNAQAKANKDNVHFPDGQCVTAVGTASGFSCPVSNNNSSMYFNYPSDAALLELLPPIPPCDGVAYLGGDGKVHEQAGKEGRGSVYSNIENSFAPGLYCINQSGNITVHSTISGTGVTFYWLSTNFTLKYNGGGGMAVQAPTSGTYKGVLMFSNFTSTPCSQNLEFRGNGSGNNVGTIFMPSACIDARGNSGASQNDSQIVGYTVSSGGGGNVDVYYNSGNNYQVPVPPKIQLVH